MGRPTSSNNKQRILFDRLNSRRRFPFQMFLKVLLIDIFLMLDYNLEGLIASSEIGNESCINVWLLKAEINFLLKSQRER